MSTKNKQKRINPLAGLHDKHAQLSSLQKKSKKALVDSESDSDSGSGSGSSGSGSSSSGSGSSSSGSGSTKRTPFSKETDSYLVEETKKMNNQRRELEHKGEQQFARVKVKEHPDEEPNIPEGELLNDIPLHPWLQTQRNDGVDPDVSPIPQLNTEARDEYDKALQLKHDKQLQKQLQNAPGSAPRPQIG